MKFYMTLIIAMLGVSLITSTLSANDKIEVEEMLGFSHHVVAMTPEQDESSYTEMVEDLKVMCRIIDETMDETFGDDYLKGGFFHRAGCQHLYLKGYGALFLLDVRFPVSEKELRVVKTKKKTNMWEKYEREVRNQRHPEEAVWVANKNESYSKEKVDKLKKQLAYLVGEYGHRIGQLAFDDRISFVVIGYSDYAAELEADFLDFEWRVAGDATSRPRDTTQELREKIQALRKVGQKLEEAGHKLEGSAEKESQDNDKIEELREKIQALRAAGRELEEAGRKLEGSATEESQDNDKKVIKPRVETVIIKDDKDEEIEDSQSKKGGRLHLRIPVTTIIPPPPTPISVPHRFRGKPATTLMLAFKRSQLEGKKGVDWEALLAAAEIVEQ